MKNARVYIENFGVHLDNLYYCIIERKKTWKLQIRNLMLKLHFSNDFFSTTAGWVNSFQQCGASEALLINVLATVTE